MKSIKSDSIENSGHNSTLSTPPTGSHDIVENKFIKYPFGKYEITVELSNDDKFLDIVEVKINKDFRSHAQRIASTNAFDVEEYYKDE